MTWQEGTDWKHQLLPGVTGDTLQTLELRGVVRAFNFWKEEPLNVVSDSLCVVGTVQRIERAMVKTLKNKILAALMTQLLHLLDQRTQPYFITHIRSHQKLHGGLTLGNDRADKLVAPAWVGPAVNKFQQAVLSHEFFHQSADVLAKQFGLTLSDARGIVQACSTCHNNGLGIGLGVNPRGLQALQLWQMDVTHVPEFGRLKYVHVCIDAFSHAMWASAQAGEGARYVIRHMCACIAALGVPMELKTDNGSGYTSQRFRRFCMNWGISHVTGIAHSPTGQAIIERAHGVLKTLLQKQKGGEELDSPHNRLAKVLYVLNFLRLTGGRSDPPIVIHSTSMQSGLANPQVTVKVQYKDPQTGVWKGPAEVKLTGRGYACILTDTGVRWLPARWIRPWKGTDSAEQG